MMKNKKIISLICALAMVFSMFSAFTVANAENTKGIALAGTLSADGKEITIEAEASGTTNDLLNSFQIALNIPEGVTAADVTATSPHGTPIVGIVNGDLQVGIVDMTGNGIAFTNKKIATIVIKLASPLSADYVATLQDDSTFDDGTEVKVGKGTMDAASVTVKKWQDPNKKPDTADRPAEDTTAGSEIPEPVVPTEKGIALKASLDSTNKIATIEAEASGTTNDLLNSFQIALNIPEGVTAADVTATSPHGTPIVGIVNGDLQVGIVDMTGNGIAFTNKKIATIVITLPEAVTSYYEFKLQNDSTFDDGSEIKVGKGTMTAASAVVTPAGNEFTGKTTPLKNYVGKDGNKDAAAVAKEAEEAGKTLYLTIDVKKADGTSAVYGTDFVANYGGKQLTAKEYNNLIHGYTSEKISDVINGLTFVYNSDVKTISTTLNAVGDETQLVQPVEDKKVGGSTPSTPKPSKPSISVAVKPTTVYVGDSVTVTAKITNPKDGGVLTVAATDESLDYVAASGIKTTVADDNKSATTTFKAADKGTNAVVLNYTYTYTDAEGVEQTVPFEKKITIKEKTTDNGGSGSGSSSSSGGTGPIANGSNTTVTNPYGPSMFKDLGDAPWASEAITMLASKNIVSGRDENTFDPNANITRAEYCQILVGAIGKSAEYADASFDDVPTDAWFYHAVAVASKYGIVSGYGDGNFGPYDLITRQDMALMTQRAAEAVGKNLTAVSDSSFTDADQISEYAQDAVYTLANAGVINGMGDGTFAPKANATRAQASVIIYTTFVK